eukprot:COSAG03_NODE_24362_length_273_cov_0.436782_1_plen_36_part_10
MLGRDRSWQVCSLDDLLCANNDSYHREIPAQLGADG